jgi:hypothetical protein
MIAFIIFSYLSLITVATPGDVLPQFASPTSDTTSPECHLSYTTDVWTGCADVLFQFNISLAYFRYVNPNLTEDCSNFQPGDTYCIFIGMQPRIASKQCSLIFKRSWQQHRNYCFSEWPLWCATKLDNDLRRQSIRQLLWIWRIVSNSYISG